MEKDPRRRCRWLLGGAQHDERTPCVLQRHAVGFICLGSGSALLLWRHFYDACPAEKINGISSSAS
jgi:hypothetical protein